MWHSVRPGYRRWTRWFYRQILFRSLSRHIFVPPRTNLCRAPLSARISDRTVELEEQRTTPPDIVIRHVNAPLSRSGKSSSTSKAIGSNRFVHLRSENERRRFFRRSIERTNEDTHTLTFSFTTHAHSRGFDAKGKDGTKRGEGEKSKHRRVTDEFLNERMTSFRSRKEKSSFTVHRHDASIISRQEEVFFLLKDQSSRRKARLSLKPARRESGEYHVHRRVSFSSIWNEVNRNDRWKP